MVMLLYGFLISYFFGVLFFLEFFFSRGLLADFGFVVSVDVAIPC